jgi:hypothetical protein
MQIGQPRLTRGRQAKLVLSYMAFCVWVAICAAAPEFLWRGLKVFIEHASLTTLWWGLMFGAILAFFIEPLLERIRHRGRFEDERGPAAAAAAAVLSALAAVAVHEVLIAISVSTHGEKSAEAAALYEAIDQVLEWALIPLVITAAWFAARHGRILGVVAAVAATCWLFGLEWFYQWETQLSIATAVPCLAILLAGQVWEARHPGPVRRLAPLLAAIASAWLIVIWLLQQLGWAVLYPSTEDLRSDVFFYVGWFLGLLLAPEPKGRVPEAKG